MIQVKNLSISTDNVPIIHDISLTIPSGTVSICMGQNGSGKSTFVQAIMGHPSYTITSGTIEIFGEDITKLPVHERAKKGIFLSQQQLFAIPGVTISTLLKESFRALCPQLSMDMYQRRLAQALSCLELSPDFLYRSVHDGFSGGEKKKGELLQLLVLQPRIAFLDEIDSGLDVDALKVVGKGLRAFRTVSPQSNLFLITHYERIIEHVSVDQVFVFQKGKLVHIGGAETVRMIEEQGYEQFS